MIKSLAAARPAYTVLGAEGVLGGGSLRAQAIMRKVDMS